MKIDIDTIGEGGLHLAEPLTAEWIAKTLAPGHGLTALTDGAMSLDVMRSGTTIVVRGKVCMPVQAPCSRCLAPVRFVDDTPIEMTLIPATEMEATGPDGELTDDQVSLGTYEAPYVDLGALIHDEVLLTTPMQPLCQQDCQGLCETCGTNRNDKNCGCQDSASLGPLGDLRHMRLSGSNTKKED